MRCLRAITVVAAGLLISMVTSGMDVVNRTMICTTLGVALLGEAEVAVADRRSKAIRDED